jgi:flavin reductase (DIM6/NTAB) family NADH-FMN oxidoreductase RutF
MAANSLTAASLEPALILVCVGKGSQTWPMIRETGLFCVNVMAHHHNNIARRFSHRGVDRFAGVLFASRQTGPALCDAVAWIDCEICREHEAGDHTIVVARVVDLDSSADARPLVFFRGRYGTFRPLDPPEEAEPRQRQPRGALL